MHASPPLQALALAAISGCVVDNPAFDEATTTASQGASSQSSTSAEATSASATSDASTGAETTGAETSLTGDPTTTADPSASTTSTTTGGAEPGVYDIPAAIGTCVFLATQEVPNHGPPAECTADADAINNSGLAGLMMIDVNVNNAAGKQRPAHPFLRFDVPAALAGLTLTAAELHVQVADNVTDLPQTGEVWLAAPFDAVSLESSAPERTLLLAGDQGEVFPNDWIVWQLPPGQLNVPGAVYIGLEPTHDKGVMLRGATTDPGPPLLRLTLE
ncbi:MAG: hypothetical protein KC486_04665 [Myxococcales bacterium]|nr:hypothetical protein [Myxococcales bacterium]